MRMTTMGTTTTTETTPPETPRMDNPIANTPAAAAVPATESLSRLPVPAMPDTPPVVHKPGDPEVEVTFVFVDAVKHGIGGLTVKFEAGDKSVTAKTDKDGAATGWTNAKRIEPIKIYVRKRSGDFDLKGTVTPRQDVNNYTIQSPEYHIDAITRLDAEQQMEEDLLIPAVKDGEIMTVDRLTGELAPYIASKQIVTEIGKVIKDNPIRKRVQIENPKTHKTRTKIEIEHHYKAVATGKPRTVAMYVLGSRLNYPKSLDISDAMYRWMQAELDQMLTSMKVIKAGDSGIEIAAIKAVTIQEAGGSGFTANGLPKILFERHIFYELTAPPKAAKGKKTTPHPYAKFSDICNPHPGGHDDGLGKEIFGEIEFDKQIKSEDKHEIYQYERFVKAALLDKGAAICACSWGAFQVLAKPYQEFGYPSPSDLANSCMESIDGQCRLFIAFLKSKDKRSAIVDLYNKNWEGFTAKYNGKNWRTVNPDYASNMKMNYENFK
jgi:hypothetical protein